MKLELQPCTIRDAKRFVAQHHRRRKAPAGARFAISVRLGSELVGVAIAGDPIARMLRDGWTIEITRVATTGERNACSMLYRACTRAALAMGYRRVITYSLKSEPGTSLRAAAFRVVAEVRGGRSWDTPSRPRDPGDQQAKLRWEAA